MTRHLPVKYEKKSIFSDMSNAQSPRDSLNADLPN